MQEDQCCHLKRIRGRKGQDLDLGQLEANGDAGLGDAGDAGMGIESQEIKVRRGPKVGILTPKTRNTESEDVLQNQGHRKELESLVLSQVLLQLACRDQDTVGVERRACAREIRRPLAQNREFSIPAAVSR